MQRAEYLVGSLPLVLDDAYRSREPLLFWGEIAGEIALIGGLGALLVNLARHRQPPAANDA